MATNTTNKAGKQLGSVKQIAADAIEAGMGYRQATLLVNDNRAAVPQSAGTAHPLHVSIAAVHGAMMRLKLVTTNFLNFKQVSSDVNSPWAKASFF